jgi:hypothetical protein
MLKGPNRQGKTPAAGKRSHQAQVELSAIVAAGSMVGCSMLSSN